MLKKINVIDVSLLITGCISPIRIQKNLYLKDINERESQYIDSIKYYICNTEIKQIVFCENSNFKSNHIEELYILAKQHNKIFEWIAFEGNALKVQENGKGYGEGEIIKYALENSKILNKTEYFFKVTGRLKVINIDTIYKKISTYSAFNFDIYRSKAFDTRFYFVDKKFYIKYLEDLYLFVTENENHVVALEDIFYEKLSNQRTKCLPRYPRIEGISGGNGIDYCKTSNRSFCFYNILCFLRVFNIFYPLYVTRKRKIME